jgi:DNA-directed RNA polymerase subunit beta'
MLVKLPREIGKTRDITGGLPRVAELFEARRPKNPAIVAEIDGQVEIKGTRKGKRKTVVVGEHQSKEYEIPQGKHLKVHEGDYVAAGQQLCDGNIDPHDILRVKGDKEVQEYLVNEIQEVYRLQGVEINDKHLECIVRKMLRKVKIETVGDTEFLPEQIVDKFTFRDVNEKMVTRRKKPATASPILQGITEAALSTDSFISAASFQKTTHILAEAAFSGKRDSLLGLKENVIMGHLIPAGLGAFDASRIQLHVTEEPAEEVQEAAEEELVREN